MTVLATNDDNGDGNEIVITRKNQKSRRRQGPGWSKKTRQMRTSAIPEAGKTIPLHIRLIAASGSPSVLINCASLNDHQPQGGKDNYLCLSVQLTPPGKTYTAAIEFPPQHRRSPLRPPPLRLPRTSCLQRTSANVSSDGKISPK
ncbi:hypothetical protein E2C01_005952 [Portunus trituberculatus]|uniref:Uncharacterized protein n=1 Tax=Portunus trituberculatus TaxID=210409 RepID=A0A5B7CTQ3_PORTR|nr:hypothetical protein [Portunus trituberculatus]